jgi:hypothetical protein
MQQAVFEKKADQMGDFYMYYQKRDSNIITFGICTTDLNNTHIQSKLRGTKVNKGEVLLWNWRYDTPLRVRYDKIKKLTPLGAVLKNDR